MSYRFSAQLTADGSQAKAEFASTGKAAEKLGKDVETLGGKGKKADAEFAALRAELDRYQAEVRSLTTAHAAATAQMSAQEAQITTLQAQIARLGRTHQGATGNIASMTAQYNDLIVMMAAGQNPIQLALQQGTQITQAFGPGAAAGAFRVLRAGIVSLLSPVNLITIGSIAAGAAMFQWLTSAGEEAESLDDVLERLGGSIDEVRQRASMSAAEVRKEFGSISPEIGRMLADIRRFGLENLETEASAAADALVQQIGEGALRISRAARRAGDQAGREAIQASLAQLYNAGDTQERIAAVDALRRSILGVKAATAEVAQEQENVRRTIVLAEEQFRRMEATQRATADALAELWTSARDGAQEYVATRLAEFETASSILAAMREENEILRLTLQYGADSAQVAEARANAERRAQEEQIESLGITGELADEMRRALEESIALSQVDIASGIAAAASSAAQLAQNLGISVANASRLMAIRQRSGSADPVVFDPRDPRYDPIAAEAARLGESAGRISPFDPRRAPRVSSRGGSGGGGRGRGTSEAERQAEAIERLIESEQRELDLLRESDPVQRELLRHRETLAQASDAQRAAVQQLIATRIEEERQMDQLIARQEFFGDVSLDALDSLILRGEDAADVMEALKMAIARAALEAIWLGTGPLAGIFGGGGEGGLFGMIFGGVPGKKDGGPIYGEGGGRQDKQLIAASPGEYIVNARAAADNFHLLEALNAGAFPRYAAGGYVGRGGASGGGMRSADGAAGSMQIEVLPSELFEVRVRENAERTTARGLRDYDRNVAPKSYSRIKKDPRGLGR